MSGWHLVHKNKPNVSIKWYTSKRSAKRGMRKNNNAECWTEVSLCRFGGIYREWSEKNQDYAPYQVMSDYDYYLIKEPVDKPE